MRHAGLVVDERIRIQPRCCFDEAPVAFSRSDVAPRLIGMCDPCDGITQPVTIDASVLGADPKTTQSRETRAIHLVKSLLLARGVSLVRALPLAALRLLFASAGQLAGALLSPTGPLAEWDLFSLRQNLTPEVSES